MHSSANSPTQNEIRSLREGIQRHYQTYHQFDQDRFPDFSFNTNRANYEPLRDSFEVEFYEIRKIDRANPNVYIPRTNTLALLFTDDTYVPSKKILNTCRSYAQSALNPGVDPNVPALALPQQEASGASQANWPLVVGLVILVCLGALFLSKQTWFSPPPSGLVINRPAPRSTVPQEVIVDGKAMNAKTVWLAVRAKTTGLIWVQPPILVQDNGNWIGVIYVGDTTDKNKGITCQIRAFVNPTNKLTSGEVVPNWPDAELSSAVVEVIKGPRHP